jgi:cytochrome c oxidase subunit 2
VAKPSGLVLPVQVIAQQWEFTYRYPTYGGVEVPHLVLPADTLIRLHVTSLDAIHSFWAYQLGVKADANPGVDNVVYVTTKGPLQFDIHCAELCGLWHGYMFDTGHVVDASTFKGWIKRQQTYFQPVMRYLPPYATSYLPDPTKRAG